MNKFIWCVILFIYSLISFFPLTANAAEKDTVEIEMDGYGTYEYPYLISSEHELDNLREVVNSGNALAGTWFALTTDINLQDKTIKPISDQNSGMLFQGGFDGRGHRIYNFYIDEENGGASFFGRLDGVVENLELDGIISGEVASSYANGGYGNILNCISNCEISAKTAAGIVNDWNGSIQNAVFQGKMDAMTVAGIVNSGNGQASYVYSDTDYAGECLSIDNYAKIAEIGTDKVIGILNESAEQFFFTSSYGKWLHKWELQEEKISFAEDIAAFWGTGSARNPFVIDSADKLKVMANFINSGFTFHNLYLLQTKDIDLSNTEWNLLADDSVIFSGTYDGNGHTIGKLNTGSATGGLFKNFNGKILNLKLLDCETLQGCGFAGYMGGASLILNSYCNGNISDFSSLSALTQAEQLVNCYIENWMEPTADELNAGLYDLVLNYAIHCGELYTWTGKEDILEFDVNFKDIYLEKERLYWTGHGVEKDPYQIASLEDFVYLRESVYYNEHFWRYWFVQTNDIDFSGIHYWRAISDDTAANSFYGNYDGAGYKMSNFRQYDAAMTAGETIFGNLSGKIMNVHVVGCQSTGVGNGILAYNINNTAKVLNNVIEIGESSVNSAQSIVYNNNGQVLNNIIVCPNSTYGVTIAQKRGKKDEETGTPIQDYNQIVTKIDSIVADKFNDGTLRAALRTKQRITNLNLLSMTDDFYSLTNQISLKSQVGREFMIKTALYNPLLFLALLWLIGCFGFYAINAILSIRKKELILNGKNALQLTAILGIYFAFILAMLVLKPSAVWSKIGIFVNIILFCIFVICIVLSVKKVRKPYSERRNILQYIPIIIAFFITAVVAVLHYNIPIAYDADLYYGSFEQAVLNFNFSFTGYMDSFCIASKPMHGIAMLMTIGEALDPGTGTGVYICNTLLLLTAQFSIYKICKKLFPDLSDYMDALLSFCFAFSGYIIAGVTYINPDFYSVVTFAAFLFFFLYEYNIAAVFCGFLVLCSKPNMLVAYLAFMSVVVIYELLNRKFKLKLRLSYTIPVAAYLILYFGTNSLNRAGNPASSQMEFINTIASRLLQYLAFGFIWIQEIFILGALICLLKNKRLKLFSDKRNMIIFATWLSCFTQLLITVLGGNTLQLCPRYLAVCAIKNILLFGMAMSVLPLSRAKRYIAAGGLSILLFVQLFVTIDPLILATTEVKFDALHYLVFPKVKQNGNDLTFYNYEYCKDAKNASEILSALNAVQIHNLCSDSRSGYKMALGSSMVYAAYWDTQRNCRTYLPNENCIRLKMTSITNGMNTRTKDKFSDLTIVLRTSKAYAIEGNLSADKQSIIIGEFTVYHGN